MISVMIVDDERLERILIAKSYEWQTNGFEIVAEASNGEEGLALFQEKRPQLVITDINMPRMNGLDFAKSIREIEPRTQVMILTGFHEFSYAQSAVNIGVYSFLLKPLNRNELAAMAKKAKTAILADQREEKEKLKVQSELHHMVRDGFLQRLVNGRVSQLEFEELVQDAELRILKKKLFCIYAKSSFTAPKEWHCIRFEYFLGGTVVLVSPEQGETEESLADEINANDLGADNYIGVSCSFFGPDEIKGAFRQACEAADALQMVDTCGCSTYSRLFSEGSVLSAHKESDAILQDYIELLTTGRWRDALRLGSDYLQMAESSYASCSLRLSLRHLLTISFECLGDTGVVIPEDIWNNVIDSANSVSNLFHARRCFANGMRMIRKCMNGLESGRRHSKIVEQALNYIQTNYSDAQLSLKTLARSLYINDSYLSRVFKKEVGKGIAEYIVDTRIARAQEYLKDPSLKIYQVAERVGFNDPHYFGQCFKKVMGLTVREYCNLP